MARVDHAALCAYVSAGASYADAAARFHTTLKYAASVVRKADRQVFRSPRVSSAVPDAPAPRAIVYNGIDVAGADWLLDRGVNLCVVSRRYGFGSNMSLLEAVAGGPGGIGLEEARRRLQAGEPRADVAFRARLRLAALDTALRRHALDRQVKQTGEKEAEEAKSEERYWTPDRVDKLALLWARGVSASGCAARMGDDCTKGRVLGVAYRRRKAGDARFYDRRQAEPEDKDGLRRYLGAMARTLMGDLPIGTWVKEAKRLGLKGVEGPWIQRGEWGHMSPARLLQVVALLGAEVQVEATVTLNGVSEAVVMPLHGRSPI